MDSTLIYYTALAILEENLKNADLQFSYAPCLTLQLRDTDTELTPLVTSGFSRLLVISGLILKIVEYP